MSSLPARMKEIKLNMKALECLQYFSHNKSMGILSDAQGQLTPQSLLWPDFELVREAMDVLVTCKYEEDPIKMKALECSQHFPHYNPLGAIGCHGNQSSDPTCPRPYAAFPHPNNASNKFGWKRLSGCRDNHV